MILLCNGTWVPDEPFKGADERRLQGIDFLVRFRDDPHGPNEVQKDATLKMHIGRLVPEFWFVTRAVWLAATPRPMADQTLPRSPNSRSLVDEMIAAHTAAAVHVDFVDEYVQAKLITYEVSVHLPSSALVIVKDFVLFAREQKGVEISDEDARASLERVMQYKRGHTVRNFAARPRTSINAYLTLQNGVAVVMTLRPEAA